jgi:hypothetical protein
LKAGTVIVVLCFVVCACGAGGHLSESGFRAKANAICRELNRRAASVGPPTAKSFERRIADIELGIGELSRFKPPPQDRARYADFLTRLRRLLAFAKNTGPQLLALSQQLERAMPKRVTASGARRFKRLARLIAALEKPAQKDAHLAGVDARALHLPACAVGASGG